MVTNKEIADILSNIAEYLSMDDVPFKPRAYERVAESILGLEEEVTSLYKREGRKAILDIPGVGASIADHIEELLKTGRLKYYEQLKKEAPVDLATLTRVEGLGPKKIKKLYEKLKIRNLDDLEKAAKEGKIGTLEGFGKKSEENILKGIAFVRASGGRMLLGHAMPEVKVIEERLKKIKAVQHIAVAGSIRRRKETVGDIDILVVAHDTDSVMDAFTKMPEVARVYAKGPTKSMVHLKIGIDADLRVVPPESYGAALNYFTGSKDHNVHLRKIAIRKGLKLNEYGLYRGEKQIAGKTEENIYESLGLQYIEPEMREDLGEVELAEKKELPDLIVYDDLKGDLQTQTNWTDGADSIRVMAESAMKRGLEYIVITDHTKRLAMTGGLDEKKILKQIEEIQELNKEFKKKNFHILAGSECDILKDGSLDISDEVLSQLDVVGISVHSYFNLPIEEQTARVVRAMQNPHADILFHPTGRRIGRRPAYPIDMEEIIATAKKTGTILEIDAFPDRLDLKDDYIRKCVKAGVKMSIDSDAHSKEHFSVLEYGIAQARRGWAEKKDIINTHPVHEMLSYLKDGKNH